MTDGSSVSVGTIARGVLRHGARLPTEGEGYVIQPLWASRSSNYGTDEMVAALANVSRRVEREYPGAMLQIGDLSIKGGGDSVLHRSHQNGRDADLIYYAVDDQGHPAPAAESMPRYGWDLRAHEPAPQEHGVVFGPLSPRSFDLPRNWALVRAILEDPDIEVQYLFMNDALKQKLLEWARVQGEDPALLDYANALLTQPGDSLPHDDHLHVRIFCSQDDRPFGCADRGRILWPKRRYKSSSTVLGATLDGITQALAQLVGGRRGWRMHGIVP